MREWIKLPGVVMLAIAAAWLITGCESGGDSSGGGVKTIAVGAQAPEGSPLDKGSEHMTADQAKQFFDGTEPRMAIMCHANDPFTVSGGSGDYNPEELIKTGAYTIKANSDGTLTATASDYVSPNGSGLVWKFAGYRIEGAPNPLITDNPLVLQPGDQVDTFHAYWNSFQPK